jgi:hypothetical protein
VPAGRGDGEAHCLATAFVARYCSPAEAFMAGLGKELRDLFTEGDAQWRDLRSDRRGARCAKSANTDANLAECCARSDKAELP